MGQVHKLKTSYATPTFAHAVETFLFAHTAAGAWSPGTTVKYRQTLTALAARLAGTPVGDNVAALDTDAGATALAQAYTAAFGTTAPATRVRHLSTLRSALAWWRESAGWITGDPTAGWVRPKVAVDTTRALTRDQVAALWRVDVGLRDKTLWRLLYETAARAEEILTLDVGDLDLDPVAEFVPAPVGPRAGRRPGRHRGNRPDLPLLGRTSQGPANAHRNHRRPKPPDRHLRPTSMGTADLEAVG
ncbi:tyrosine-type recombinase/integrase [Micromonospora fulviviridis]|uniref:Core-binding (CB) domain-containing protein n=1 Tax=Micromonospora fulviviridis TaxID=47860 RepID=A0ABV2VVQ9_9ACTN